MSKHVRRSLPLVIAALVWGVVVWTTRTPRVTVADLPPVREAAAAVGKRLGQKLSPGDLTRISAKGDRVLAQLTRAERWAMGRNAVRFRVDRRAVVDVAAPARSAPFWLSDQGFARTRVRVRNDLGDFEVYRRTFPAGVIGLGANALDRSSPAHYAVVIRAEDGGPLRVDPVDQDGPPPVVPAGTETSPFSDRFQPFETIPPEWKGSSYVQTSHERRHDGALAAGRVWKARQPSGPRPDQVVVSLGEDPARGLTWTWRTDPSVTTSAVRIASEAGPGTVRVIQGHALPISSDGLLNDPTILRHRAIATDLEPDTRYRYAVGDGSPEGWGPWRTIRTAPAGKGDFSFLYLGDAQCGLERWGELLRRMARHRPDAGFMLLAGDLVDRGNERTNWDHFFLRAEGVFDAVPLMPAVGNHEYLDKGPDIYRKTFELPRNGPPGIDPNLVYAFEYSDAFFAVLDSNLAIYDDDMARLQASWLDEALSRTGATWKFVSFHHPIHASHQTREYPQLGPAWAPVFEKHGVDLVLQGHDHAYLRTHPMRGGRPSGPEDRAPIYVIAVSGDKFCEPDPRDYTARGFSDVATYQAIDIQVRERRLTYRAYDRDGREVDSLVIEKGADAPAIDEVAATPAG